MDVLDSDQEKSDDMPASREVVDCILVVVAPEKGSSRAPLGDAPISDGDD
jgi:hypothetical protein